MRRWAYLDSPVMMEEVDDVLDDMGIVLVVVFVIYCSFKIL